MWAATSPLLAGLGGVHCEDCDIADHPQDAGAVPNQGDPLAEAARLWALSADLTGAHAFAASDAASPGGRVST